MTAISEPIRSKRHYKPRVYATPLYRPRRLAGLDEKSRRRVFGAFRRHRAAAIKCDFGLGALTSEQGTIVEGLIREEWLAMVADEAGDSRAATDHRRVLLQYQRALRESLKEGPMPAWDDPFGGLGLPR